MKSNIVHQYFKKEEDGVKILLQINPIHLRGHEITIGDNGIEDREIEFGPNIIEELKSNGYAESSPLEFNLYFTGLAG
ncbi:MAG: hypothetical protein ACOYW3_11680 [Bacteroidota bacterium]